MAQADELLTILKRIAEGQDTETDRQQLRDLLNQSDGLPSVLQVGKYSINIQQGENIRIGDCIYYSWDDDAIQALVRELKRTNHVPSSETCQNRQALDRYLNTTLEKLRQNGCLDMRQNVTQGSQTFSHVARIEDFELPFGPINMRGEAFFVFSEFSSIQMRTLRQFSGQALQWAKTQTHSKAVGSALYNFRVPTHLCFAIALIDQVDEATRTDIRTVNPLDHRLDLLWYEVPIVYELSQERLHFYNQPSSFWEQFKGEIAWKRLRAVVEQLLVPSRDSGE